MITLRSLTIQDTDSLVKYADNKKIADNLRDAFPHPYEEKHAQEFIKNAMEPETKKMIRAIDLNGELIGCIGAFVQDDIYCKNCEIGYWLAEPFWGKGIVTDALQKFVPLVFEKFEVTRIYAEPFENNIGSQKALEKAGFTLEAKLKNNIFKNGKVMGSYIYTCLKP